MTLKKLAEALGVALIGAAGDEEVRGVAGLDDLTALTTEAGAGLDSEADPTAFAAGYVTYAEDERRLASAEATPALAVITRPGLSSSKPMLSSPNPRLTFARALALTQPPARVLPPGIHPLAQVGAGVSLGEGVAVGAFAVIGEGAQIGPRTQVHPLASVGAETVIGADCVIYPNTTLYERVRLGSKVIVHAGSVIGSPGFGYVWDGEKHVWIPHVGTVVIGDEVEIGACSCIDRGTTGATVIGRGTKIDNLVQIAHNVKIGENCVIAGQVGLSGSVKLEDGVMLAGQAGVADHVRMATGAIGAAGADIIRDIPAGQVVIGRPARPIRQQMRIDAAAPHLPDLVREVRELRKRVEELEKGRKA